MSWKGCVLVTGGAGYIGSHVVVQLIAEGWRPVVVDDLSTGLRTLLPAEAEFIHGDAGNIELITALLARHRCQTVLHFAGSTIVPESLAHPLKYYSNNTAVGRNLLAACVAAGVRAFLFSSTAAVYGEPIRLPVSEDAPTRPISPYGSSKLMTEWMVRDVAAAAGLRFIILRYFNVAGADPAGRTGQCTPQASHLIKVACEVATGKRPALTIFGEDYDTADGTCVRDFIHVSDLAAAHVAALAHLATGGGSDVVNCGYGRGFSVRQVVETTGRLARAPLTLTVGPRRAGDIPVMIADTHRIRRLLRWQPRYDDLDIIIGSALAWERRMARAERPS